VSLARRGRVRGLAGLTPDLERAIGKALATGTPPRPERRVALAGSGGRLLGGAEGDAPFALRAPVGTVVENAHPTFRWRSLKDATRYTVTVVDDAAQRDLITSQPLPAEPSGKEMEWRLPETAEPLQRDRVYRWYVVATLPGGEEVQSPGTTGTARFQVLAAPLAAELERARALDPPSRLAMGTAYARAGMNRQAEREFAALLRSNPNSAIARRLLGNIRRRR